MMQQLDDVSRDRLERATERLEQIEKTLIELDRLEQQQRDRQAIAALRARLDSVDKRLG